ncbi:MAG: hypothetical protein HYX72_13815 [Acidobacteria bacterium]|nr:hypothetical protein [Acidobacteriota bacterium]
MFRPSTIAMNALFQWPAGLNFPLSIAAASTALSVTAWLLIRSRGKKSPAERERDRRMALNANGRMTDGVLTDAALDSGDPAETALLFYRYSISGVEYSAAQDVSCLRNMIPVGNYLAGETVMVKYDQHCPSNSIVVCESWSGLITQPLRRRLLPKLNRPVVN